MTTPIPVLFSMLNVVRSQYGNGPLTNLLYAMIQDLGGGSGSTTDAIKVVIASFDFNGGTSVDSIPANSTILRTDTVISTVFAGPGPDPTITVGRAGNLTLLQDDTDNDPLVVAHNEANNVDTSWGGADLPVIVTVSNATSGDGFVVVEYVVTPNTLWQTNLEN